MERAELELRLNDPIWLLRRAADILEGSADTADVLLEGGAEEDEEA
jgi:hypothetical protein